MTSEILALLRGTPAYSEVREALRRGASPPLVIGPGGSAASLVVAAAATDPAIAGGIRRVLAIAPDRGSAVRLASDLTALLAEEGWRVVAYTGPEVQPAEVEHTREQLAALAALRGQEATAVVAPAAALAEPLPSPESLELATIRVRAGQILPRGHLVRVIEAGGYQRTGLVASRGEFAVRGGIVDLFPPDAEAPVRVDLWGDEVDSVRTFDPLSQRGLDLLDEAVVRPALLDPERVGPAWVSLADYLPPGGMLALLEPAECETAVQSQTRREASLEAPQGRMTLAVSAARTPRGRWQETRMAAAGVEAHGGQTHLLAQMLTSLAGEGLHVVVASAQAERMAGVLRGAGVEIGLAEPGAAGAFLPGTITAVQAPLWRGFRLDWAGLAVVTDAEIVGWRRRRPRMRFLREGERITSFADLSPGDLVVHLHHGIGRYRGLVRMGADGAEREYMLLEYAAEDRLYVPTDQVGLVNRYIGSEGEQVRIHRLGGADWEREKRRVKEAAREMAASLLSLYAARASAPGHTFGPDTHWQREMEEAFPHRETPDQRAAIEQVKRDMESPRPMDRLVAGDVGYGKTEVAMRAAFKAVMEGKQVAVVVPTTVLAQQHYNVFSERFARFPVTVEMISRFRSPSEQQEILRRTASGGVDVLIGTHRILAKDVRFRDLGLVVIDEEQRFGVAHKERLKALRRSVDVLTLTATPIPRTLHMSLSGLRDMTVMETPPEARLPVHTEIRPQSDETIRYAIEREIARGGQVYVVHNRVMSIERAARRIRALVPEARVAVAHGQMGEERLEAVMLDFLGGHTDVLVCTTIVEIGLDIAQVNTVVIEDAHLMGLAQLYQLRGRVGRADRQAYCYLLYPQNVPLTPEAEQRLRAMAEFVELGSGLGLAMRDLEIRGAGNILGPEQHGHVAAVGFDLYCRLLDEAIREARGEIVEEPRDPTLELGVSAHLPLSYVPSEADRIAFYRGLGAARTAEEVEEAAAQMQERWGPAPDPALALLDAARLRVAPRDAGVASIARQGGAFVVRFSEGGHMDDEAQRQLRAALGRRAQVTANGVTVPASGRTFGEQAASLADLIRLAGRLSLRAAAG